MIRVLQIVNIMDRAGLETMLMNYYRELDRTAVQFDFLTHRKQEGAYDKEIVKLGGRVYHAPRLFPQNYIQYMNFMDMFWSHHPEYNVVHSHIESMSYLPLLSAKRAGVPIRIAHSHSSSLDIDFRLPLKMVFKTLTPTVANYYAACSQEAGQFLFKDRKVTIIPNAINEKQFYYNKDVRDKKRKELSVTNNFVVGHVGRFTRAKNHRFLIKVFKEISRKKTNAILLLIGSGELEEKIKKQIEKNNLEDKVIVLSNRSDIYELYQAMDIFLFPSLYEGLGMSAVEAQVAGLKCFLSDKVPEDAIITSSTERLPLDHKIWVEKICNWDGSKKRASVYSEMYDAKQVVKKLQSYYENLLTQSCIS